MVHPSLSYSHSPPIVIDTTDNDDRTHLPHELELVPPVVHKHVRSIRGDLTKPPSSTDPRTDELLILSEIFNHYSMLHMLELGARHGRMHISTAPDNDHKASAMQLVSPISHIELNFLQHAAMLIALASCPHLERFAGICHRIWGTADAAKQHSALEQPVLPALEILPTLSWISVYDEAECPVQASLIDCALRAGTLRRLRTAVYQIGAAKVMRDHTGTSINITHLSINSSALLLDEEANCHAEPGTDDYTVAACNYRKAHSLIGSLLFEQDVSNAVAILKCCPMVQHLDLWNFTEAVLEPLLNALKGRLRSLTGHFHLCGRDLVRAKLLELLGDDGGDIHPALWNLRLIAIDDDPKEDEDLVEIAQERRFMVADFSGDWWERMDQM